MRAFKGDEMNLDFRFVLGTQFSFLFLTASHILYIPSVLWCIYFSLYGYVLLQGYMFLLTGRIYE